MRSVKYEFRGSEYVLAVTAAALFSIYDQFGTGDVLETTKCMDPSLDGWESCCHLAALLSRSRARSSGNTSTAQACRRSTRNISCAPHRRRTPSTCAARSARRFVSASRGRSPRTGTRRSTSCSLSGSGRTPKKKRIPRRDPGAVAGRGGALPQLERARGAAPLAGGVFRHDRRRLAAEAGRVPRLGGRR